MRPGPYTRPQAGRNRPEWVVSIDRNAWSGFGIYSRSEESAALDPWTGWRCAKSPNCPSSAAHLSRSLRDVSLRRRVHGVEVGKESGCTFGSCCRTGAAMVD